MKAFEWMTYDYNDMYSDIFIKLLKEKTSSMTEIECRKMVSMFSDDYSEIDKIKKCREDLKDTLLLCKDYTAITEGRSLDDYIRDAFPFEMLFIVRY